MGFAVLLVLLAYVLLARAVARGVEKKTGSKTAKYVTIAIFVLIPTWDIIPGWLYFEYLCNTQAGQRIYKTVQLPPEYFLKAGEPDSSRRGASGNIAIATGGELNRAKLRERYQSGDERHKKPFHVTEVYFFVKNKNTGELLGSATRFEQTGGWLADSFKEQVSPRICPKEKFDPYEPTIYDTLPQKLFTPLKLSSEEREISNARPS